MQKCKKSKVKSKARKKKKKRKIKKRIYMVQYYFQERKKQDYTKEPQKKKRRDKSKGLVLQKSQEQYETHKKRLGKGLVSTNQKNSKMNIYSLLLALTYTVKAGFSQEIFIFINIYSKNIPFLQQSSGEKKKKKRKKPRTNQRKKKKE